MPTTVNGIGTHYYGTKNAQNRAGVCRACGAAATLQSYDTRLWFVILYIPVIPLGRKRIIDQCSRCKRHWVVPKHQWEAQKQLSVSSAMEQYRAQPSAEAALALHGQFLGFHMIDEAEKFRQGVLPLYSANPMLLAGLAEQMEHMGRFTDATPLFEQALALKPDMPEACLGVARRRLVEGKLDEAHQLLSFLEKPGAVQSYSLGPLEQLAHAYQAEGRHDDA